MGSSSTFSGGARSANAFMTRGQPPRPACGDGCPIRPEPLEPPMRERQDGAAGLRRERDVDLGLPRPVWIPPRERSSRGTRLPLVRVPHRPVAGHPPRDESTSSIDTVSVEDRDGPRPPAGRMGGAGPGRRAPRDPPGRGRSVRRHRVGATASRRLLLLADIDLHALAGALRAARDDDLQDAIVVGRLQVLGVHV
jgi:hypothetical protein